MTERMLGLGISVCASVATEYGAKLLEKREGLSVLSGRLDEEEITALLQKNAFACVADCTHPFASAVTANIKAACAASGTPYIRVLRERLGSGGTQGAEKSVKCNSFTEAAVALSDTTGGVLFTIGTNDLHSFAALPDFSERAYVRVLPVESSLAICRELGVRQNHIIAMQGPFSTEMNIELLKWCKAQCLVTKETGKNGGFPEKLAAAAAVGVQVIVIAPPEEDGLSISNAIEKICKANY